MYTIKVVFSSIKTNSEIMRSKVDEAEISLEVMAFNIDSSNFIASSIVILVYIIALYICLRLLLVEAIVTVLVDVGATVAEDGKTIFVRKEMTMVITGDHRYADAIVYKELILSVNVMNGVDRAVDPDESTQFGVALDMH